MRAPLIMVSAGLHPQQNAGNEVESILVGVDLNYLDALVVAGAVPLMLPAMVEAGDLPAALEAADGLLLTGGDDIHASAYGEEPVAESTRHDHARDRMEIEVIRAAMALRLPILGICRGLQMLNVVHGGSLVQDLTTQVPEAGRHLPGGMELVMQHRIHIEPGTLLSAVMGGVEGMDVNSWHHQAVKELGAGLRVSARAADGVIEGIESDTGRPLLAVQCHPEESVGVFPAFRNLFRWLVDEARRCHAAR